MKTTPIFRWKKDALPSIGILWLILSLNFIFISKGHTQCLNDCPKDDLCISLNDEGDFEIPIKKIEISPPSGCNSSDYEYRIRSAKTDWIDLDLSIDISSDPFEIDSITIAPFVGRSLILEIRNGNEICERKVTVLPYIQLEYDVLCSHPVLGSPRDVLVLQLTTIPAAVPNLNVRITSSTALPDVKNCSFTNGSFERTWIVRIGDKCDTTVTQKVNVLGFGSLTDALPTSIECIYYDPNMPTDSFPAPFIEISGERHHLKVEDDFCGKSIAFTDNSNGDVCVRSIERVWTATCEDGTVSNLYTQNIDLVDNLPPTWTYKSPYGNIKTSDGSGNDVDAQLLEVELDAHNCKGVYTLPDMELFDDCNLKDPLGVEVTNLTTGATVTDFTEEFMIMRDTVVYSIEIEDKCMNDTTYYLMVRGVDRTPPTATCNEAYNLTMVPTQDITWLHVYKLKSYSGDNCGVQQVFGRRMDWETAYDDLEFKEEILKQDTMFNEWVKNDKVFPCDDTNPYAINKQVLIDEGWNESIAFVCRDIGETIKVELMIIDMSCNYSKCWSNVYVEDKLPAQLIKPLEDVTIACQAWDEFYKDDIISGSGIVDKAKLNELFGKLVNRTIPLADATTDVVTIKNYTCTTTKGVNDITSADFTINDGIISSSCNNYTQTATYIPDPMCGLHRIERVWTSNGVVVHKQIIQLEKICEVTKLDFDFPEKYHVVYDTVPLSRLTMDAQGHVDITTVAPKLRNPNIICNELAEGYIDKIFTMTNTGGEDYMVERKWCFLDMCGQKSSADIPSDPSLWPSNKDWKVIMFKQYIKVHIDNNATVSSNTSTQITGVIKTVNGERVNLVQVEDGMESFSMTATNAMGEYKLSTTSKRFQIQPSKRTDFDNGVSTLDIIKVLRHILGKSPLDNPYDLIASDVNQDKRISVADLVWMKALILQKRHELPNDVSWRFVDADYKFKTPLEAHKEDFPEYKLFNDPREKNYIANFIGVKLGDLNNSVVTSRSSHSWSLAPQIKSLGQNRYQVDFHAKEAISLSGLQLGLSLDNATIEDLQSDILAIDDKSIDINEASLKASISLEEDIAISAGELVFSLIVSDFDGLTSFTPKHIDFGSEAYDQDLSVRPIVFAQEIPSFKVYQNIPNPFDYESVIPVESSTGGEMTLRVYDVTGKMIYQKTKDVQLGRDQFVLKASDLKPGVLIYDISNGQERTSKRMLVIE